MYLSTFTVAVLFSAAVQLINCESDSEYPSCGECWCIPSDNGLGPCPVWQPQSNFSSDVIETYKKQMPSSIYSLNCNPYDDASCTTTPPQTLIDSDDAVCGYVYETDPADGSQLSCIDYSMITFPARSEAEKSGAVVTHEGSCGLCSTTQDLAIYLSK